MTPTIAIQDVLVPHREIVRDLDACRGAGIEPVLFGLIPFTDIVSMDDDARARPAVPFGSVKIVRLWQDGKTPPGWRVFYDAETFDQRHWSRAIGRFALNQGADWAPLGAVKHQHWGCGAFVKPTDDLKAFAGMVVAPGETIAGRLAETTQDASLHDGVPVLIAPVRDILCEFRCYMRGEYMIAASQYRTGLRANARVPSESENATLRRFVGALATMFTPALFYTIDVAVLPDHALRVVEYNCINCAGRYEIDRGALFRAVLSGEQRQQDDGP